jgi:hypothetical protein
LCFNSTSVSSAGPTAPEEILEPFLFLPLPIQRLNNRLPAGQAGTQHFFYNFSFNNSASTTHFPSEF